MDLDTIFKIVFIADGLASFFLIVWIITGGMREADIKVGRKPKDKELIRGVVGKDIFTCPYGHHFLRDEAIMFADNVNREIRIYCPVCWERGRRVLVAREKMDTPVIIEAPRTQATELSGESSESVGVDMSKVFDDINVRFRKIEEAINEVLRRLEKVERENVATMVEEGEVVIKQAEEVEKELEEERTKKRRRKR